MALAFWAVLYFRSLLIFSPFSPCHVFINMKLFLLCFPSVFILDFTVIYLPTFFLLLRVLLWTIWYHKRINTSVYKEVPLKIFQTFFYCTALKFWIFEVIPGPCKMVENSLLIPEGQVWSLKLMSQNFHSSSWLQYQSSLCSSGWNPNHKSVNN